MINWRPETYIYTQVADLVRGRILDGTYPPGSRISELKLQEEFEAQGRPVARPTIRKGMSILRDEKLIVTLVGKGSVVIFNSGDLLED